MAGGPLIAVALVAMALTLGADVGAAGSGPGIARAGCGGLKAEVVPMSRFPKAFASQYRRKLRVRVERRKGSVRKWHVELYTFSGFLLGKSKTDERLSRGEVAKIKLKQAMQPGPYTVVVKGKAGGCGERETADIIRLRGCLGKLPIKFVKRPKGLASDYNSGGFVSVKVAPRPAWAPLRKIESTLSGFDGIVYGTAELPPGSKRLIGEQFLDHELTRNLEPGEYSISVTGKAPQPKSCGDTSRSTVLKFE